MIKKTHPPASESRKTRPSSDILTHCDIALEKITSLSTVTFIITWPWWDGNATKRKWDQKSCCLDSCEWKTELFNTILSEKLENMQGSKLVKGRVTVWTKKACCHNLLLQDYCIGNDIHCHNHKSEQKRMVWRWCLLIFQTVLQRPKKSELSGWQLSTRKNFPDEVSKLFLR